MRIALIPGHGWRPTPADLSKTHWDPGACVDDLSEAVVVRAVASLACAIQPTLTIHDALGREGPGTLYRERHAAALAALGADGGVILHLHANAGGGRYPAIFHDPRSRLGAVAARSIANAVDLGASAHPSLAGLTSCKVFAAARPAWDRVANLVEPSWAAPANVCGVVVELGFIDQEAHAGLWQRAGLNALAKVLANLALE